MKPAAGHGADSGLTLTFHGTDLDLKEHPWFSDVVVEHHQFLVHLMASTQQTPRSFSFS